MAQPSLTRRAAAQEAPQKDSSAVLKAKNDVGTHLAAIKKTFEQQKNASMAQQVAYSDPNMNALLDSLVKFNDALKPFKDNADTFKLEGTPQQKFQSLLNILNAAVFSPQALSSLEMKVSLEAGTISADAVAEGGAPGATSAGPASTGSAVPAIVPGAEERTMAQQIVKDLEFISQHGTKTQQGQAKGHIRRLNRALEKHMKANERRKERALRDLTKLADRAKKVVDDNLDSAQDRALKNAPVAAGTETDHKMQAELKSLLDAFQSMSSVQGYKSDLASKAAFLVHRVWSLGDPQMRKMAKSLKAALEELNNAASAQDVAQKAKPKYDEAKGLYDKEQKVFLLMVELAEKIAEKGVEEAQTLPKWGELRRMERRDGVSAGTYFHRNRKGIHNGSEMIERVMKKRKETASRLKAKRGELSFHLVSDLLNSVTQEENVLRVVVDMLNYANGKGAARLSQDKNLRTDFWSAYGRATKTITDPNSNPYQYYPPQVRKAIVEMYIYATTGSTPNPDEYKSAEKQVITVLNHSEPYRYFDMLFDLYNVTRLFAPEVDALAGAEAAAVKPVVKLLSVLRSTRAIMDFDYSPYLGAMKGMNEKIDEKLMTPQQLQMVREYVGDAIAAVKSSGWKDDTPEVKAAKAKLDAAQNVPAANIAKVSDELYHVAVGLLALREAQLWRDLWQKNEGLRPSSVTPEVLSKAVKDIGMARQEYVYRFSVPQVDSGQYPNNPRSVADAVIRSLTPKALEATEASAGYTAVAVNANPGMELSTLKSSYTKAEKAKAAAHAEELHLRMLLDLRNNNDFGVSAAERSLRQSGYLNAFALLHPIVSRKERLKSVIISRKRLTVHPIDYAMAETDKDGTQAREQLEQHQWGTLFIEATRQGWLKKDKNAPDVLKQQDAAGYVRKMEKLSADYADKTPAQMAKGEDALLMEMLDDRATQLQSMLNQTSRFGGNVFVGDLQFSNEAGSHRVKRACWACEQLRRLRQRQDLFSENGLGRNAVALAEMAIADVRPGNFEGLGQPTRLAQLQQLSQLPAGTEFILKEGKKIDHKPGSIEIGDTLYKLHIYRIDVNDINAKVGGETLSISGLEDKFGKQKLFSLWFMNQKGARPDEWYLLSGRYNPRVKGSQFIGKLVRGVTILDSKGKVMEDSSGQPFTADVYVRLRPTKYDGTTGPANIEVLQGGKSVRIENILYAVDAKLNPVRTGMWGKILKDNLSTVAAYRPEVTTTQGKRQFTSYVLGEDVQPVVLIEGSGRLETTAAVSTSSGAGTGGAQLKFRCKE